jgi:hypothetical protein
MKLSKEQQNMFWNEFRVYAARYEAKDRKEADELRKELILRTCGKGSLTEVNKGLEFDAVLHHMANVTGNKALYERTANGGNRRMYSLVRGNVEKILTKGKMNADSRYCGVSETDIRYYCAAILRKREMELPDAVDWYTALSPATMLSLVKITSIAANRIKPSYCL